MIVTLDAAAYRALLGALGNLEMVVKRQYMDSGVREDQLQAAYGEIDRTLAAANATAKFSE